MKNSVKEALRRINLLEVAFCIHWLARPLVVYHNIPYWLRGAEDGLPIPPLRLRSLVWGEYVDLRNFFEEQGQLDHLFDVLTGTGANVEEFRAILDFGCGAGRAIRQIPQLKRSLEKATFHGTDINPKQIDWCRRNLPFAQFEVNRATPPLTCSDEQFDFIYTFSVLTHLSEAQQFSWMAELSRVLKPGGYLLITTCGESYFETLSENEKAQFRQDQLVVRHQELAGIPGSYADCIAFHPVSYVREKLTKGFELIHFSLGIASRSGPKGEMDHFFLRKPPIAVR